MSSLYYGEYKTAFQRRRGVWNEADLKRKQTNWAENMNRQKKIKQLLKAHAKKASAKLAPANKSRYISKADRLKLAAEASDDSISSSENA
ncbi:hypothetical protein PS850_05613 [Pseudomonas fluorescens]|nr:hypothetical protein PS850_05613 [Pseudomonas fluorescens]